jgi:hypothetical protein
VATNRSISSSKWGVMTLLMLKIPSNSFNLLSTALDPRTRSVRRDAERGGRDDRAPRTLYAISSRDCTIANLLCGGHRPPLQCIGAQRRHYNN